MQVTDVGFLRWFNTAGEPGLPRPPYAYWRDRERCEYAPILSPGEANSFYVNNADGFLKSIFDPDGLRLGLFSPDNVLVATGLDFDYLTHPTDATRFFPYTTFVVPALANGYYFLKFYSSVDGTEFLRSSYLYTNNDRATLLKTTTFCKFRHDRQFYNVRYQNIPGFYQQLRLNISVTAEQVEGETEVYDEVTTGETRLYESVEKLAVTFESRDFDADAHKAAAVMVKHNFLELNGRRFSYKSGYKSNPRALTKYSKAEFELYDQAFSAINRCQ